MNTGKEGKSRETILFRMNRANNRSRLGKKSEAISDYEKVILEIEDSPQKAKLDDVRAQVHIILGEEYAESGDTASALKHLEAGQDYYHRLSLDKINAADNRSDPLHYHGKAAKILRAAWRPDEAVSHLYQAIELLRSEVTHGSVPSTWESMLGSWSTLYDSLIELQIQSGKDPCEALVEAESCKGRLVTWITGGLRKGSDAFALDREHHRAALEKCAGWCGEAEKRYIVSFYGTDNGLALFAVSGNDTCKAVWIPDAPYQTLLTDYYTPWEALFEASEEDPRLLTYIGGATELLLDRVGEWMSRLLPEITDGGDEIVLVPHLLFRSLPLSHARLPGGRRLSELFRCVYCLPSLYDFSKALNTRIHPAPPLRDMQGFADPDETLPFARFEGNLIMGADKLKTGNDVTVAAVTQALRTSRTVLLSCHGDFDESNPWDSKLRLSDGLLGFEVLFMTGQQPGLGFLVLGACEAARHRHSMSDEPVGFAGMLVMLGVASAVLAPMWKVDDFASALFLTDFFRRITGGVHPAAAAQQAAFHVRDLTARDTLEILRDWSSRLSGNEDISEGAFNQLELCREWLSGQKWNIRPFRSPRDWAAFQLIGFPVMNMETPPSI